MLVQISYMAILLELEVISQLQSGGSAFAIALPGPQGRALHAKGIDRKRKLLLELRKVRLETELEVPLDGWATDSPEYKAAMKLLADSEILRLQVRGFDFRA
jgi:hypothetical protein